MKTYPLLIASMLTLLGHAAGPSAASRNPAFPPKELSQGDGSGISAAQDAGAAPQNPAAQSFGWNEIGAKATEQYSGEGLAVTASENGALLNCVFQKLRGEATRQGLWLDSTVPDAPDSRFRVVATSVGRSSDAPGVTRPATELPATGKVEVKDKLARFIRPGLVEEYSVSMDGVRQDFVVAEKPGEAGKLRVELAVSGACVEQTAFGAQLILPNSGRKIAYSRLRVTDATGKALTARIEVAAAQPIMPAATALAVLVEDAEAVYPVRIDPTFSDANWVSLNPGIPGANAAVSAAVVDGSGNLYIGGYFTLAGTVAASHIAKWNGSAWSALGTGMNTNVNALAVIGTDLYAGGTFTTAGGLPANRIAKWNGSTWSALGTGTSGSVNALTVIGTHLYAGGSFTTAGGLPANRIARWNGSAWSNLGTGMNSTVYALAVSGTNLYAGGEFSTAGGVSANNIAKWNGSAWSALGTGMDNDVHALAVSGTDLYAGGVFTTAGGVSANNIAKWNGSAWSALGTGMNGGIFIPIVYALAVSGTDLYAGGEFITARAE